MRIFKGFIPLILICTFMQTCTAYAEDDLSKDEKIESAFIAAEVVMSRKLHRQLHKFVKDPYYHKLHVRQHVLIESLARMMRHHIKKKGRRASLK